MMMTITENKSIEEIAVITEALLFVADRPVSVHELARTIDTSAGNIEKALAFLEEAYELRQLRIQRKGSRG
jgi:chromosome segregation and condensation protein ScpB